MKTLSQRYGSSMIVCHLNSDRFGPLFDRKRIRKRRQIDNQFKGF